MKDCTIDASVAVKWYLPEEHSEKAHLLLVSKVTMHAPDLLLAEMGNVFWKRVRRGEVDRGKFSECLRAMMHISIQIVPTVDVIEKAHELAIQTGRTVYDCLYLATALRSNTRLVTADQRFLDALKGGPFEPLMLWIEDLG